MVIQSISRNLLLFLPGLIYTGALDHQNYGLINGEKCGLSTKDENSNDGPVLVGDFPWMVLISVKKNSYASSETSHCAGTILNENYVLTAAHCLTDKKNTHVSSAKVYLPVCTSSEEGIAHNSETIIVHPDYRDEYKHGYDIGLIRVKEAFDFNELVAPICLVHGDLLKQHYDGEKGQVAGFEAYKFAGTEYNKPICPNEIQKFTVPILNEQVCRTRIQQSTPPHSWSSPTVLNSQRIVGGRNASLGEFPWMASVKTTHIHANSIVESECGGTIINKNYILTAAHCTSNTGSIKNTYEVKIGEFDKSKNPDCVGGVCAPKHISLEIEEVITPPNYFWVAAGNDITLMRVRGEIKFNDFVAPICLEHGPLMTHDYAGESAQVAGWGGYAFADEDRKKVLTPSVLQKLTVPILDNPSCEEALLRMAYRYKDYHIVESQVCVATVNERFPFVGDSGGPLMVVKQIDPDSPPRYYEIGLLSYGERMEGKKPLKNPSIFTRVRYYLPWILDNIRP